MSVEGKGLPSETTILATLDQSARSAIGRAQVQLAPIVSRETPKRSGRTAAALRPRVRRTKLGWALSVQAPRGARHGEVTVNQLVRWLTRGTGKYRTEGPNVKAIHAKNRARRMNLGHGVRRWTVKGQHPKPFIERIRLLGTPHVLEAAREGASEAARALEREF